MVKERLLETLPHYLAMFLLILLVISNIRRTFGRLPFAIEFGIVIALCLVYLGIVSYLGIAPDAWKLDWESE
jgi:hypothetical protein